MTDLARIAAIMAASAGWRPSPYRIENTIDMYDRLAMLDLLQLGKRPRRVNGPVIQLPAGRAHVTSERPKSKRWKRRQRGKGAA